MGLGHTKRILRWGILLISIGFIVYVFRNERDGLKLFLDIRTPELVWLMSFIFMYFALHGYRYLVVLEKFSECVIGFRPWFRIYILGRFLNTIVPQSGNLYRSIYLKRKFHVAYTRYVGAYITFAWMGACFNLLLSVIVMLFVGAGSTLAGVPASYVVIALLVSLFGLPFAMSWAFRAVNLGNGRFSWVYHKIDETITVSLSSLRDARFMVHFFSVGIALFVVTCAIFWIIFRSLGIEPNLSQVALFFVLLQLISYVSFTPGNLGFQEVAFGVLAELTGVGMAEGIVISVLLRIATYIALIALAVPLGGLGLIRGFDQMRQE